ncbi:large subunit of sulfate adenylyltransferase [Vitreoscilla sp. C1]|uniref:sulfate adenylyltransferase subunit 1 n=1 Tax=Vitreoscilla sp. (strain C1) TaxID=96942 RepID=UPI000CDC8BAA|nr:GTP-binding protein [Vitreoscilla sp. C1]AUZ05985.1 large subunit of sulfate adenylyltransferase [Vitreoscilla sp. C1]
MTTPVSVLRFITAGSVDDGKSTLIGRLLYDSQALLADQVAQLNKRSAGGTLDLASLTDGLEAEREQGITIDVAYRYFSTPKRKFIIADTPGHEQYTRNMVTGASTADAAIVLVDATRLDFEQSPLQLLSQTKRHSTLLKQIGCRHIIVAVNKLDLLDYSQEKFKQIVTAYRQLADTIGLKDVYYVPISALNGDNIVNSSEHMPWFEGAPLLTLLEGLPAAADEQISDMPEEAYLPVQRVARQDGSAADDFRGYQGRIEAGVFSVGQAVRVEPSARTSTISAIYGVQGEVARASRGDVVTITLTDDVDISRGDVLVASDSIVVPTKFLSATLSWLDERPLNTARKYWLKHGTQTVYAKVKAIDYVWDMQTLGQTTEANDLKMNDIGHVRLSLMKPIAALEYANNRAAGAFILIDDATNHTVAAGMIVATQDQDDWAI